MAKILITGGAGFIGTHLAERFSRMSGWDITLLDNFRRDSLKYAPQLKNDSRISILSGSVEDPQLVAEAVDKADVVVHLAAIAGVSSYYKEPLHTLRTNVLGTVNVLEQAAKKGIGSLIYFSTSEIYGSDALWVEETSPCAIGPVSDLRWVYATSKLSGENFALRYADQYGFGCTIIRPFNIYGPRQVGEGAVSNFCRAVVAREPLQVYGDGSALRAWCYIDDLVDAVVLTVESSPKEERVFNIGNPREVETTLGLARKVAALEDGVKLEHKDKGHSEVRARVPSIERARRFLSFEPKISLAQGLERTLSWFRAHEHG